VLYVYNYVYLDGKNIVCEFCVARSNIRTENDPNVGIPVGVSPKMPDDVIVARLCKKAFAYGIRIYVLGIF
jgi:hypothetical protein